MKLPELFPIALLALLLITCPQTVHAASQPLATVSSALSQGETRDFTYSLPRDLDDFLLHVTVTASNPQTDTLDITIEDASWTQNATWTDLQGEWWDYWGHYVDMFGPLAAGEHTLTAAIGLNATSSISFKVELLDIPTPPFTFQGTFPANPLNDVAYIHVNLPKGNCSVAADVSTGSFALVPEGLDAIDVSGQTNRTLSFPEAGVYEFQIQPDPTRPASWSIRLGDAAVPEFPQTGLALLFPAVLAVTLVLVRRRGLRFRTT
jgi:hypothetical protein